MKILALIPARYASSRFPGKPLALLSGKFIIQHVYERVKQVFDHVYVATDDQRIYDVVFSFGGKAIMTKEEHKSGTDRCREALDKLTEDFDIVVNIQGDEPFIDRSQLKDVVSCFEDSDTDIATLIQPFSKEANLEDLENPNTPKVVVDNNGFALYFSRSIIPYIRDINKKDWLHNHIFFKHIGLYAYRTQVLRKITKLPISELEKLESLEQLRWLSFGFRIKTKKTLISTIGIDTPENLQEAEYFLQKTLLS